MSSDAVYEDIMSLIRRLNRKEITTYEYCKMMDDIIMTCTTIEFFHLPESYVRAAKLRLINH